MKIRNKNIVGKNIGDYKVLDVYLLDERKYLKCECRCGKIVEKKLKTIYANKKCACIPIWQQNSVGLISKTFFYRIKHSAKQRNIHFNISHEFIWNLYKKQEGECAMTGILISFGKEGPHDRGNASLDRIDSSIGYEEGNVWWVDKSINQMKMDFSMDEFIKLCKLVDKYN